MKKYIYSLFAAAALLLGTASCSSEDELVPSGKNEGVEVSFRLALDDAASSRAADHKPEGDLYATGKTVNHLVAAVYSGGTEISSLRKDLKDAIKEDLTCNVTFRLIEGQTYDFVFWADNDATKHYDLTDLKSIKVNYTGVKANDETRDAFTAVRKGLVVRNGDMKENIVLTRPFAQLNIASTDEDHEVAEAAGFGCDFLSSKVIIKKIHNTYDAYNETPSGSEDVVFDLAKVPGAANEVLKNVKSKTDTEGKNYIGYLAMNYFLASKDQSQNVDVVARFKSNKSSVPVEISVPNVPVQRNYRTNIIGNILTEQTIFQIIIDPNFNTPDYVVGWDGKTVTEVVPNGDTYEIEAASQLAWIAQEVNKGTTDFTGKTIKLMENINLGNAAWTPIGTSANPFVGTFDGNGKTVNSFSVHATEGAGFFGYVGGKATIQNVTVADATITGHHFGGALAGWVQSTDGNHEITITNCQAKNVSVTLTPDAQKDNGNHAGGLIGYIVRTNVTKCTVDNAQVTAYRDCGGLVGCENNGSKVTNNIVTNTTVTVDQTVEYKEANKEPNGGKVVGRREGTTIKESNQAGDDVVVIVKQVLNETQDIVSGYYILDSKTVKAETGSALTIAENATVTLEVKGNVTLTGANAGIEVPVGATLNIIGDGNLVVEGEKGSGIGNGGNKSGDATTGKILIKDLAHLTAKGNGEHAFGIGGTGAEVEIENTTVDYVKGGIVQPLLVNDKKYGTTEPEGGAAIGGAKITLNKVVVTEAHGGSKAAAIGAMFWQSTEISIDGCTITAYGGNASAGIGGSRVPGGENDDQTIVIDIANSTITSTGGEFGAGIGSGYNTHTASGKISKNDIQIINSEITANGGRYAAGIGTGYHSAALTGSIDAASTINATAGEDYYKDAYTKAQAIGYGVVDPAREYSNVEVTFTVAGKVIEEPKPAGQN